MTNSELFDSIKTQRLQLLPVSEDLAKVVAAFDGRNLAHVAPWGPPAPPGLDTETLQRERLRNAAAEVVAGTASRREASLLTWLATFRRGPEMRL